MGQIKEKVTLVGSKGQKEYNALIDTGASHTFISEKVVNETKPMEFEKIAGLTQMADGSIIKTELGWYGIIIQNCPLQAVKIAIMKNMPYDIVLGQDFLQDNRAEIDMGKDRLILKCKRYYEFNSNFKI